MRYILHSAFEDNYFIAALKMYRHRRVLANIPAPAGLRVAVEVESTVQPRSPDRHRMRPTVRLRRAYPVILGTLQTPYYPIPLKQPFLTRGHTVVFRQFGAAARDYCPVRCYFLHCT